MQVGSVVDGRVVKSAQLATFNLQLRKPLLQGRNVFVRDSDAYEAHVAQLLQGFQVLESGSRDSCEVQADGFQPWTFREMDKIGILHFRE